jgi:hypothetical protein
MVWWRQCMVFGHAKIEFDSGVDIGVCVRGM